MNNLGGVNRPRAETQFENVPLSAKSQGESRISGRSISTRITSSSLYTTISKIGKQVVAFFESLKKAKPVKTEIPSTGDPQALEKVMNQPLLKTAFKNFCIKEKSVENLIFLEFLQKGETLTDSISINNFLSELEKILDREESTSPFGAPADGSENPINLSDEFKTEVKEEISKAKADHGELKKLLKTLSDEVKDTLLADTLRRFLPEARNNPPVP